MGSFCIYGLIGLYVLSDRVICFVVFICCGFFYKFFFFSFMILGFVDIEILKLNGGIFLLLYIIMDFMF